MARSTSTGAGSRELERYVRSATSRIEALKTVHERRREVARFRAGALRPGRRDRLQRILVLLVCAIPAFATAGLGTAYTTLGVVAAAAAGAGTIVVLRKLARMRRQLIGDATMDEYIHAHLKRAVFNAGDEWSRWSDEEKTQYLVEDLALLVPGLENLARPRGD